MTRPKAHAVTVLFVMLWPVLLVATQGLNEGCMDAGSDAPPTVRELAVREPVTVKFPAVAFAKVVVPLTESTPMVDVRSRTVDTLRADMLVVPVVVRF